MEQLFCEWEEVGGQYKCRRCGTVSPQKYKLACSAAAPEEPEQHEEQPSGLWFPQPQSLVEATPAEIQELESGAKKLTNEEKLKILRKRKDEMVREYLAHPPRRPCNCGKKKPPQS